jgi:hypothetical protein
MKKNGHRTPKPGKAPAFVTRAERAFRRVAHNVKIQNRALKLPVIVWQDGKVVEKDRKVGDALYSGAITHAVENIGTTDFHVILIELKK